MPEEKQELKSKWLDCLNQLFSEAEKSGKKQIKVTYSQMRDMVNANFPDVKITASSSRAPSYYNALHSILETKDIETGTVKSTTYTVIYKLPRQKMMSASKRILIPSNKEKNDLSVFDKKDMREKYLNITLNNYRINDSGRTLYKEIVQYSGDKYSNAYIAKVYEILEAWNMNQQAARLNDPVPFQDTIKSKICVLKDLEAAKLSDISKSEIMTALKLLFFKLDLVKTNSKLVTFSKTMHFLFPNLIVPIDRKYTLSFFKIHQNNIDTFDKQWEVFEKLETTFSQFSKTVNLSEHIDTKGDWNLNVPKIIDNLIIGYELGKKKEGGFSDLVLEKSSDASEVPKRTILAKYNKRKPLPEF
jgi:hypothetical protein